MNAAGFLPAPALHGTQVGTQHVIMRLMQLQPKCADVPQCCEDPAADSVVSSLFGIPTRLEQHCLSQGAEALHSTCTQPWVQMQTWREDSNNCLSWLPQPDRAAHLGSCLM